MSPAKGSSVWRKGVHIGYVHGVTKRTWRPRRGEVHSVIITNMDVRWKRICTRGILVWSPAETRWINQLEKSTLYEVEDFASV